MAPALQLPHYVNLFLSELCLLMTHAQGSANALRIWWARVHEILFPPWKPRSCYSVGQTCRHSGNYCFRSARQNASIKDRGSGKNSDKENSIHSGTETFSQCLYIDGVYTPNNDKSKSPIPASDFTLRIIRSVSVPTLVVAEIPK